MKFTCDVFSKNNIIFCNAGKSRFLPNGFISVVIFALIWFISSFLANYIPVVPFNFIPYRTVGGVAYYTAMRRIINCGAVIFAFYIWVRFVERRKFKTLGFQYNKAIVKYFMGFFAGLLAITMIAVVFLLSGFSVLGPVNAPELGISALGGILIMLPGWAVQSASEEIAVRGWLLPVIGAKHNVPVAIFITSTIFGVLHLFNPNVTSFSFINLVLSGIFFALYVIKEGSLWGVCGFHCAWNWSMTNIFNFRVSGFSPVGGALFNISTTGPDIFTGGHFGPEGGLVTTVLLCIGIFALFIMRNRQKENKIYG